MKFVKNNTKLVYYNLYNLDMSTIPIYNMLHFLEQSSWFRTSNFLLCLKLSCRTSWCTILVNPASRTSNTACSLGPTPCCTRWPRLGCGAPFLFSATTPSRNARRPKQGDGEGDPLCLSQTHGSCITMPKNRQGRDKINSNTTWTNVSSRSHVAVNKCN